jgi:hypothetical protein
VTHTFSTVQQYCLTLKLEATRPFETPGTASHPTRTEQPATPLTEPEITLSLFEILVVFILMHYF